ncbi:MAG: HypC/HybG/HupF family hydrogenase formation chaperone [Desulfovibrio sp.]|nr:HypC/HybG/HupF family hydrogenase formation chaperone [Desulfovibrio sp.]
MCVGLSAKVVRVDKDYALVDANGARRTVGTQVLSDLEPGDYVMVHAGIAIAKITESDEEESEHLLSSLKQAPKA